MSHTPHELSEEFPEHVDAMHRLKMDNAHFGKLFDSYHDINREIHRAEVNIQPVDDFRMEDMRKQRMRLKDEIYGMLAG
jgi:uncharacterized protein YdcH (DUF465 family)